MQAATKVRENAAFDGAEEKFAQTFVALETALVAQKDLDVYEKALDQALIKFHSMKACSLSFSSTFFILFSFFVISELF